MRANHIRTAVALALSALAGNALAAPQAPHDFANGVTCNSCHIPFGGQAAALVTSAATGGDANSLTDANQGFTYAAFVGATVTFTSGANQGQSRTIADNTGTTIAWNGVNGVSGKQLPNPVAPGDGYTVSRPKNIQSTATGGTDISMTDTTQTWTPSLFVGGTLLFTSGANVNEVVTITASLSNSVQWATPLPAPVAPGDAYTLNQVSYEDIQVKCLACHNPNGRAPSTVRLHYSDVGAVGCGKCHDPHNLPGNSGYGLQQSPYGNLIRNDIRTPRGYNVTATYDPNGGVTRLVTADGKGVCQVCHTKTSIFQYGKAWPDSASHHNYQDANQAPQGCQTAGCHTHDKTFNTASQGAHFDATAAAYSDHGFTQACFRCHTSNGYRDYIGADGSPDNHLSGTFMTDGNNPVLYPYGPQKCETCHNGAADALDSVMFVSGFQYAGLNKQTAICAQCHQGRESTVSVSKSFAVALDTVNAKAVVELATTGNVDSLAGTTLLAAPGVAWTPSAWKAGTPAGNSFFVLFTSGAHLGAYRQIVDNTANSFSWKTPLASSVGANEKFVVVNAGLSGSMPLDTAVTAGFVNSHYLAAAAMLFGRDAKVAYEYPNPVTYTKTGAVSANISPKPANVVAPPGSPSYSPKNRHGVNYDDCTSCHNQHSLEIKVQVCGNCHAKEDGTPVATLDEIENGYQYGFWGDPDGDGMEEGIKPEIYGHLDQNGNRTGAYPDGILDVLFKGIQTYASTVMPDGAATYPICYKSAAYPYWFYDNGTGGGIAGNGVCEAGEAVNANQYKKFTPRLMRACYNYNLFMREPGAWAHNPRYAVELAYDGIADLTAALPCANQVGATTPNNGYSYRAQRTVSTRVTNGAIESSHFDAAGGPWQNAMFVGGGAVKYPCLRCHGAQQGFETYWSSADPFNQTAVEFQNGVTPVLGMQCYTCHTPKPGDADMKTLRDMTTDFAGGVRSPGHWGGGLLGPPSTVVLDGTKFSDKKSMICSSCHMGRDVNGVGVDQYLAGVWNDIDIPGSPFTGTSSISNNGGLIQVSGLPKYQGPGAWGTPNNWLFDAGKNTCLAVGRFVTVSGSANYNGTWSIASCTDGVATLNKAYVADEASVSWSAFAAGTRTIHDAQGGANVCGGNCGVGYQYPGKTYAGLKLHGAAKIDCIGCHQPKSSRHSMQVAEAAAAGGCNGNGCHNGIDATNYGAISNANRNLAMGGGYDGDPATTTLSAELTAFGNRLGAAINTYTLATVNRGFCLTGLPSHGQQLYYVPALGNNTGVCTPADIQAAKVWATAPFAWDAKLVRALYNLSMGWQDQDNGAWAHNFDYVAELLYDSIVDLGGDTTGLTRP